MKDQAAALLAGAKEMMQTTGEYPGPFCMSGATQHLYSPFNQCLLAQQLSRESQPATVPFYIESAQLTVNVIPCYTFSQAKERGWKIKKGSKAMIVVYGGHDAVGRVKVDGDEIRIEKNEKSDYSPRFFHVFTLDQIEIVGAVK